MSLRVIPILVAFAYPAVEPLSAQSSPGGGAAPKQAWPVSVNAYAQLGLEMNGPGFLSGKLGVQAEWNRRRSKPGLDLRLQSMPYAASGVLVGPTVAAITHGLRPYAEALFGNVPVSTSYTASGAAVSTYGVAGEVVFGVDNASSGHLRWRLFEFTQEVVSGVPNRYPRTFSTGLVVHF